MPKSPHTQSNGNGSDDSESKPPESKPNGRSSAGSGKAKRKPKPTTPEKNRKQKIKARYAKAREEAQLAGVIPTTPDGAVRDERVPPSAQEDPFHGLPAAVRQALRECWATPDKAKPAIIAALLRPFFNDQEIIDGSGNLVVVPHAPKTLNELARTILALDQTNYERENPEAAGRAKGANTPVAISVEANVLAVRILREAFERDTGGGQTALPPPFEPSPSGNGRFDGEVETGAASTSDQ